MNSNRCEARSPVSYSGVRGNMLKGVKGMEKDKGRGKKVE